MPTGYTAPQMGSSCEEEEETKVWSADVVRPSKELTVS